VGRHLAAPDLNRGNVKPGRTPLILVIVIALALTGAGVWYVAGLSSPDVAAQPVDGSVIEEYPPDDRIEVTPINGTMLDGSQFDSRDLLGTVVVYNVWGSWCGPCIKEAPELVEVARQTAGDVQFVGLNVRDNESAARAFERDHQVPYGSIISDDSEKALLAFGGAMVAAAVPATLIVDRQGRVAARVVGPTTAPTLSALLQPIVAENP